MVVPCVKKDSALKAQRPQPHNVCSEQVVHLNCSVYGNQNTILTSSIYNPDFSSHRWHLVTLTHIFATLKRCSVRISVRRPHRGSRVLMISTQPGYRHAGNSTPIYYIICKEHGHLDRCHHRCGHHFKMTSEIRKPHLVRCRLLLAKQDR